MSDATHSFPTDRLARSRAAVAVIAENDAILRRTTAIVNRLSPAVHPQLSGAVMDWSRQLAFEQARREREALHKAIWPRIERKVRLAAEAAVAGRG